MNGEEFNVLWDFLLVCEANNLIKFNYSLEVSKTKVQHCIHEHKLAHPSLDWHLTSNPHSQTTSGTDSEEIFDDVINPSHVTPPLQSSIENLLETPSCLPPPPPLTTSVRYRIVGEIPLPKDRRKTNFNFNISLSDSMFDDSISHENVSCDVSCEEKDVFSDKGDLSCGKLEQVLFDDENEDKINEDEEEDEDYQEVGDKEQEIGEDDQEVVEDDQEVEEDDQEVVEDDQEVEEDDQEVVEDDQEVVEDDQEVEEDYQEEDDDDQEVVEDDQEVEEDDQEVVEDDQEVEEDDQEEDEDDQEVEEDDQEEDEEKEYKVQLLKKNRKEEMDENGLQMSEIQDDKQHVESDYDRKQEIREENMTSHYKTPPSTINLISDDSDDDDKLENLFSNLRLQSAKKETKANKIISRKSLNVFIVSDSEEISGDEENNENRPPHTESPVSSNYHRKHLKSPCVSPGVCSTPVYQHKSRTLVQNSLTTPSASKSVRRCRNQMTEELFQLFNKTIFNNNFPADMEIKWNRRLRTTAGYCAFKGSITCRTASIEMSTKVCDSYDRIRDTLIHELCHAATWVIDGMRKAGHGRAWKCWAKRAHDIYPDLSPITRCHHYEISYKYTYNCTRCDFKIGRHSKSVNLQTARCPYCMSCLELL